MTDNYCNPTADRRIYVLCFCYLYNIADEFTVRYLAEIKINNRLSFYFVGNIYYLKKKKCRGRNKNLGNCYHKGLHGKPGNMLFAWNSTENKRFQHNSGATTIAKNLLLLNCCLTYVFFTLYSGRHYFSVHLFLWVHPPQCYVNIFQNLLI